MSRAAFFRQRLPCVGLFLGATAGVLLGRLGPPIPGGLLAAAAAIALLAALLTTLLAAPPPTRPPTRSRARDLGSTLVRALLPLGVALTFAAAQTWQHRESPAARLAESLASLPTSSSTSTSSSSSTSSSTSTSSSPTTPTAGQSARARLVILAPPEPAGADRWRGIARLDHLRIGAREWTPGCRVLVRGTGPPLLYGGHYEAIGPLANCPPPRNPGEFDYAAWLANDGIRSEFRLLRPRDAQLLTLGGNPLVRFAHAARAWIERTITLGIAGTPEAALIVGMTIGDTSAASPSLQDDFRETGTFHLFSVSGLHVGIVALLLWTTLGLLGVPPRRAVLLVIPALFLYALVTGLSAPSLRAAIMLTLVAGALLVDRSPVPLNGIGAAGLVILAGNSSQLFHAGFQLSFAAITAILLLALPAQRRIDAFLTPDPFLPPWFIPRWRRFAVGAAGFFAALAVVSTAAWLASLPLTLLYFHLVSFSSIAANLLAVPLSTGVLALVAVSLVAGAFSPGLAEVFNHANFLLAKLMLALVQSFAALPGSALYVAPPPAADTLATLTVFDAGPGGAAALLTRSGTWIIDPGSEFFATATTIPFLRLHGVNHLDALVLTHGDTQHLGGALRLLDALRPRVVLDSGLPDRSPTRRRLLAHLRAAGIPVETARAGFTVPVDLADPTNPANPATTHPVRVRVLYPPTAIAPVYADDKALVLRLEAGPFAALLLSDAGLATEQWLLAHAAADLPCDLVTLGRHAHDGSAPLDLLRAAAPRVVITSAAAFPPSEDVPPALGETTRALGIDLLRQDVTGAITITITADHFTAAPFLPAGGPARTFPPAPAPRP